jgi:purine-binding chemotaxis protein CheW
MSRKKKLNAGLNGLFSTPKKSGKEQPASSTTESETDAPSLEQSEITSSTPEQSAIVPTTELEEIKPAEEIMVKPVEVPLPQTKPPPPIPEPAADTDGREVQLVVFTLADEHFGLDINSVESIIKLQPITVVPRARAYIEGITNLRGAVLPVVDLRKRFDMPVEQGSKDTRIVVVEVGNTTIGMIVDTVTEVLRVPQKNIAPPSPIVATIDSNYITGIAKMDDSQGTPGRLIVLLDLEQLLSTEETTDSLN